MPIEICIEKYVGPIKSAFNARRVNIRGISSRQGSTFLYVVHTVKLGDKELFDKEQIGVREPFAMTNLPFTS